MIFPRGFVRSVVIPALIPLLILAVVKSFSQSTGFGPLEVVLIAAFYVFYLRRLNTFLGAGQDSVHEIRRFRRMFWLLPLLFLVSAACRSGIPGKAPHLVVVWISFVATAVCSMPLLAILLSATRLAPGLKLKRFKTFVTAAILLIAVVSDMPEASRFLVCFVVGVWIFAFEDLTQVPNRGRVKFTLLCLGGILVLAMVSFRAPVVFTLGEKGRAVAAGSASDILGVLSAFAAKAFETLRLLLSSVLLILPGKIILRPLANWFKFSLRIRTKLLLSYILSSVIPGLLLVLIFSFGIMFLMGGYWQRFVSQLVVSRASTMQILVPQSNLPWPAEIEKRFLSEIKADGISAILLETSKENARGKVRYEGISLPSSLVADSTLLSIGGKNLSGLITLNDSLLYLATWTRRGEYAIGLFRRFGPADLDEMKKQCGTDLAVLSGLDFTVGPAAGGATSVEMSAEKARMQMSTRKSPARWSLLNLPISFPIVSPGMNPDAGAKSGRSQTVFLVETSLRSMIKDFMSTEHVVNRVYLMAFAVLAVFFGGILVLVALVGFGLASGITRSVGLLSRGTQQLRDGDMTVNINVKSRDELGELAQSFNLMVADINRMLIEVKEKERLEGELEAARAIQMRLLPGRIPEVPGFEVAAAFLPAKQVGGDYYDFISLPGERLGFALGDVSGKGMPAALLMSNIQAALHALVESDPAPGGLVSKLNRSLYLSTPPEMFATFFYGMLDVADGKLTYVNAGHNLPIVCGNGVSKNLSEGGMLLGVVPDHSYGEGMITLNHGEVITIYSDGVTEAMDVDSAQFGEDRLTQLIEGNCAEGAEAILSLILRDVEQFCGTPQDDVTVIVIKRN